MKVAVNINGLLHDYIGMYDSQNMPPLRYDLIERVKGLSEDHYVCFFVNKNEMPSDHFSLYSQHLPNLLSDMGFAGYDIHLATPQADFYVNFEDDLDSVKTEKKRRLIIALGDSWSYGVGSSDVDVYSWPAALAERTESDFVNLGIPGGSNKMTAELLSVGGPISEVSKYDDVIVIFGLTTVHRSGIISEKGMVRASAGDPFGCNDAKALSYAYLSSCWSDDEYSVAETLLAISTVNLYCDLYNFKLLVLPIWADDIDLILSTETGNLLGTVNFSNFDFSNGILSKHLTPEHMNDGHPNDVGYALLAKEIHRILLKRGLV